MLAQPISMERRETLAKRYFVAGFLGLPWLWGFNAIWLWKHRGATDAIGRYFRWSVVGFVVGCVVFVTFLVVIRACCADAGIWIIRPGVAEKQQGIYSDAVFNDLPS
jgi:hypothetical protein